MIRGYVAIVGSNSPLPDIPAATECYRKAAVRLSTATIDKDGEERVGFQISVEETTCSFQVPVVSNIRKIDKDCIASGIVRIGFVQPNVDLVVSCNFSDLKKFVYTVEVIQNLEQPLKFEHDAWGFCYIDDEDRPERFSEYYVCERQFVVCHYYDHAVHGDTFCSICPRLIVCDYNIVKPVFMKTLREISVTSYAYVTTIIASGNNLVEIPEELGLLPCLRELDLRNNRLGEATDWNWLVSPFMRENLYSLWLTQNGLSTFPDAVAELKSLMTLGLSKNCLTELPVAMTKLKNLRELYVENNRLTILPSWMKRKVQFCGQFCELHIRGNHFELAKCNNRLQLKREDFDTTRVPSLMESAGKIIITQRFPFWEYNIPPLLVDYLETAYYCDCGSLVFRDTTRPVIHCRIRMSYLHFYRNYNNDLYVCMALGCCSYKCYKGANSHYLYYY